MSSGPVEQVLSHFPHAKRSGRGAMVTCPCHEDSTASLKVDEGQDGRALLDCKAGCDTRAIVAKLGLSMSDLFPQKEPVTTGAKSKVDKAVYEKLWPELAPCVEVYSYRDEQDKVIYQSVRFEPPGKSKTFRQCVPLNNGHFQKFLNGQRKVPYMLSRFLHADPALPVYIPEGEKDVITLIKRGLVATTNVSGADGWEAEYAHYFKDRHVVVLPDNDSAGRKHAYAVAASCKLFAASVKVLELPDLPDKEDVTYWFEHGGTEADLQEMTDWCPEWEPSSAPSPYDLPSAADLFSEVEVELKWLAEDCLTDDGFSLFVARPKVGKSTLIRNLIIAVLHGSEWLGRKCTQGPVIYYAMEEKRDAVKAELRGLGLRSTDPLYSHLAPAPQNALEVLSAQIVKYKPVLVVIDPLIRFLRLSDANDYAQVYAALTPLVDTARQHRCHLAALHHSNKMIQFENGQPTGTLSTMGSTAFTGNPDSTIVIARMNDNKRVLWSEQRYGLDFAPSVLSFDYDTKEIRLAAPLDEYELLETERKITAYLATCPEGATNDDIRKNVEARTERIVGALRVLTAGDNPQVRRLGTGKRGDSFRYHLVSSPYANPVPGHITT